LKELFKSTEWKESNKELDVLLQGHDGQSQEINVKGFSKISLVSFSSFVFQHV